MKEEEFRRLALKYVENRCSPQEKKVVEHFFQDMQDVNRDLPIEFSEEKKQKIFGEILKKIRKPERAKTFLLHRTASIAAVLIGVIGISFLCSLVLFSPEETITRVTAKAEKKEILLEDGSRVFLNSNSNITYRKDFEKKRNVSVQGEAFFEVKSNPDKPFRISIGSVEVKVLGTSFNIHAYQDDNISVSVNTGKVEVRNEESTDLIKLTKNQRVQFRKGFPPSVTTVEAENLNAWKDNEIILDKTSLANTAEILENWYDVQIVFEDEYLKDLTISGRFKEEQLGNVLESIAFIKQLEIEYQTEKQIIIREKSDSSRLPEKNDPSLR